MPQFFTVHFSLLSAKKMSALRQTSFLHLLRQIGEVLHHGGAAGRVVAAPPAAEQA